MSAWHRSASCLRLREFRAAGIRPQQLQRGIASVRRITDALENGQLLRDSQIQVNGFVRSLRKQKRIAFAAITDGSTTTPLQVVLNSEQAEQLSIGAAVRLRGQWMQSAGRGQAFELKASHVEVTGDNDAQHYPIQNKYHTPDFLRTLPHLRARTVSSTAHLRLRSRVIGSLTSFFANKGFIQTHPPVITSSDCEGAGEVFTVTTKDDRATNPAQQGVETHDRHYFRSKKYLTVSSQLHLEALAQAVGNVWALTPTFRAEKSDTSRHLSEFYMLEAEMAFTNGLEDIMSLVESMIQTVAADLANSRMGTELADLQRTISGESSLEDAFPLDLRQRWQGLLQSKWERITYAEAIDRLQSALQRGISFNTPPESEEGLQTEHERYLAAEVGQGSPIFVTDYPSFMKPFYMAPTSAEDSIQPASTAACFDLLVPELCEIVGGSLREHRLKPLVRSMEAKGLHPETLDWYLDLRRYGSVPHGGFGLGFDRFLCYLAGVNNIRDMVSFPRWHGRCDC